tara:strand:+ start:30 stop:377 length:348 start_codon:yes stop_codon:yes gene_type:complete
MEEMSLEEMTLEEVLDSFQGRLQISGTNTSYINRQINKLESKDLLTDDEKDQLYKYYSEIKKTKDGQKKPKTCWKFVKTGKCTHCDKNDKNYGIILANKWHPEKEERLYLKNHLK